MRQTLTKLNTRLMALALSAMLLFSLAPAAHAAEASGDCGDSLTWTVKDDTLTISGSGPMWDFKDGVMATWYDYREEISRVILPEGLTRVGDLAFYDCNQLRTVVIPDSVEEVGWYAFAKCHSMTMLDLSDNLKIIEEAAFRECSSLRSLRLPNGLKEMGFQAFYRCESLSSVTIPESVTKLGMTTFAYCYELIRADVKAKITALPDWTFYGCAKLTDVSLPSTLTGSNEYAFYGCESLKNIEYSGTQSNKTQIESDIARDLEGELRDNVVSSDKNSGSTENITAEQDGENVKLQMDTSTQTENADINTSLTVTVPADGSEGKQSEAKVDVTIENANGWSEIKDTLLDIVDQADTTQVDVYMKEDSSLSGEALTGLAGKNVTMAIHDTQGTSWQTDCSTLVPDAMADAYDFSYERLPATEKQIELLGGAMGYQLKFANKMQINAEILIKLPVEHARQHASLYQIDSGELKLLQTVVVDQSGYAHFYLASVDDETEYLIGINVPQASKSDAIVPEALHKEYGITDTLAPVEYVITGRTSSWGIGLGQVTLRIAIVLVVCFAAVGVVMYLLNKRKLRMGYVPELDDEWDES